MTITPEMEATLREFQQAVENGMDSGEVADRIFQAIHDSRFYILTHPEYMSIVMSRIEAIKRGKNPPPLVELMAMLNQ